MPVYRGAPNIEDYTPGPASFLHVTPTMTPEELAARLAYLDANDTAYEEYHAWRTAATAGHIREKSPLAERLAHSARSGGSAECIVCEAVHRGVSGEAHGRLAL